MIQNKYSLRPTIFAHLRPDTQTNLLCEITKIHIVFCEKDRDIVLFFVRRLRILLFFMVVESKYQFLWDKFQSLNVQLFWDGWSIIRFVSL